MGYETKVIETLSPYEALKLEQNNTNEELDFKIVDFKIICTSTKPIKRKVYQKSDLDLFYADEFFVKNYNNIAQEFAIEIYPSASKSQDNPFEISLISNKDFTHLEAIITCFQHFTFYDGLKYDILQKLYKSMIKQNFLIIRLDKDLLNNIENFVQSYKENKGRKELRFLIAKGVDKIEHKSDQAIYYRQFKEQCFKDNANYDERDYCNPIQKNELIFEYVYRQLGQEGRNLKGEILHPQTIKFNDNPFELKDDSIYTQELEDRIRFFSACYGFLHKDKQGYSVINNLKLDQIGLKTTGSIKTDLNKDITVEISNNDVIDDAIKSGIVKVEASNVNVNGSIGATTVNVKNIHIKGLTHAKSKIYTQNAFINTHKGYLEADTVYIRNLENGVVRAKNVYVENCTSATIEAENIYICDLIMDNTIQVQKNLIIQNKIKTGNKIIVSYNIDSNSEYKNIEALSCKIQNKLKKLIRDMNNLYNYLVNNQVQAIKIKSSQENSKIKNQFLLFYENNIEKYNNLNSIYKKLSRLKYQTDVKLSSLKQAIYNATIFIKSEEINDSNFLYFYPQDSNLELKHALSLKDCKKMFFLEIEKEKPQIRSKYIDNEIKINEILSTFENFKKDNF
ncbi:flagellar assembly protein A [Campylobacter jejuni]|uniref:flagellar assembly protein A n=1 Tax=Campylobacter jejuni TaxID=197 RepID=UPI000576B7FA|nr:flagellar assembly protein A [Campylobacter jejuni]